MVYLYYLMSQHNNLTVLTIINLILQVGNQDIEKLKWFTLVHIVCRLVPEAMPPSPNRMPFVLSKAQTDFFREVKWEVVPNCCLTVESRLSAKLSEPPGNISLYGIGYLFVCFVYWFANNLKMLNSWKNDRPIKSLSLWFLLISSIFHIEVNWGN